MFIRNRQTLAVALFVVLLACHCGRDSDEKVPAPSTRIEGKKIAMVVGQRYFKDEELEVPKALFEKEGALVSIVSSKLDSAESDLGTKVKPDIPIDDLSVAEFDAIVFIGGTGVKRDFWESPVAYAVAQEAVKQDKILAAICWGSVVLANAGVLEGKKATGHTAQNAHEILKSKGCDYTGASVTVDGNIITGFGPSNADSFAVAIIEALE